MTGYVAMCVSLSPTKPLDQSKNVTVRTFHIWPGSVHEQFFLALGVLASYPYIGILKYLSDLPNNH